MRAWEDFLSGVEGRPLARGLVVSSWQRSLEHGVDAHGHAAPLPVSDEGIHELRLSHRSLLAAASPTLAQAVDLLTGTGSIMLVTDPRGVVLESVGDRRTIASAREIHLEPGGDWNECVAGTNGIGTALVTRQPVLVHAAEHFCEGIKSWTCAGAPIHDPDDGTIIGLLDISGPKATFQRHNLALAVVAAHQIERALAEQARADRLRLLEASLEQIQGWVSDGVVTLDRHGRVLQVSDRARTLLRHWALSDNLEKGMRIVDLEGAWQARDWAARLPPGLPPDWVRPIVSNGETMGALLVIPARPKPERQGRATVSSSAHEGDLERGSFEGIVGASAALRAAMERARRIARRRAPVLIEGETGVGKELFARAIHGSGPGSEGPFVAFNCGAVSKELLASELFGYVKGAFTGAAAEGRPGRFELAHGGTLCLDEIGELPLDLQPYLLRVLEEGVVYRVGDHRPRRVDVRLIAMTNRVLSEEVAAGRFRRDLYYRIGVLNLRIPPLRDRTGDTDLLIRHFCDRLAFRHGLCPCGLAPDALEALRRYPWPGNVRELRNLVESLLLMVEGEEITVDDLPPELRPTAAGAPVGETRAPEGVPLNLEDGERRTIEEAMRRHEGGNLAQVARTLGISRSTLYRKMERYSIARP